MSYFNSKEIKNQIEIGEKMKKMKRVYVAGPYRADCSFQVEKNVREARSEERRVGKECRSRRSPDH